MQNQQPELCSRSNNTYSQDHRDVPGHTSEIHREKQTATNTYQKHFETHTKKKTQKVM